MNHKIKCLIREKFVEKTKEELVRQNLLSLMIGQLGYPKNLMAVEKDIQKLPHLIFQKDRSLIRRADIICFGDSKHTDYELFPLLMIECKAGLIADKARMQLIGYNLIVKAPFIALANKKRVETGWYDVISKKYKFVPLLPKYTDLTRLYLA